MSESNITSEQGPPAAGSAPPTEADASTGLLHRKSVGVGGVIAVVVLLAFVAWVVIESTGSSFPKPATATPPVASSAAQLKSQAAAAGQRVYWVGAEPNSTYEFTQNATGVLVRYLPAGVAAGDATARLTVGTYPMKNAYNVMNASSIKAGAQPLTVPGGGIAIVSTTRPSSVYVAFPKSNYQIEVYDPTPAKALRFATSGSLQTVLGGSTVSAAQAHGPVAATPDDLRILAAALGHPVYWAGPRPNTTLELTQTASGRTYVRYLPSGVAVGSSNPYLTIATYPLAHAYAVTKSATKDKNAVTIKLPNNGIAVYTKGNGTNVHLAYQGSETQVEVYDPHPSVPPRLVSSGQVVAV